MRVYFNTGKGVWSKNLLLEGDLRTMDELELRRYIFNLTDLLKAVYNSAVKYSPHRELNDKAKKTISEHSQECKSLYREIFCRDYIELPKWGLPNKKEARRVEVAKAAKEREAKKNKVISEKKNKTKAKIQKNRERVKAANRQNPVRKDKSKQDG